MMMNMENKTRLNITTLLCVTFFFFLKIHLDLFHLQTGKFSGGFKGGAQGARAPPFLTQVYNVYHFEGQRINNVT